MPRNNVRADSRFQKAVEYQIKNPNLTVYDSMKLADFSLREREDKAKYMMVIRLLNKTKKDDFVTPPALPSITVSRSSSDLISSVTMSADGVGVGVTSAPAKKAKHVRSTATAKQMLRKAAFEKKNEYNTAVPAGSSDWASFRKVAVSEPPPAADHRDDDDGTKRGRHASFSGPRGHAHVLAARERGEGENPNEQGSIQAKPLLRDPIRFEFSGCASPRRP
jgi:hypothetical protein